MSKLHNHALSVSEMLRNLSIMISKKGKGRPLQFWREAAEKREVCVREKERREDGADEGCSVLFSSSAFGLTGDILSFSLTSVLGSLF